MMENQALGILPTSFREVILLYLSQRGPSVQIWSSLHGFPLQLRLYPSATLTIMYLKVRYLLIPMGRMILAF